MQGFSRYCLGLVSMGFIFVHLLKQMQNFAILVSPRFLLCISRVQNGGITMTGLQADKLMTLYRKAIKAAMMTERAAPGATTHNHAIADFERADKAFSDFVRGVAMTIYGYARVSTDGQTLDAQVASLREAGAEKVFSEKVSGAKTDRQQLQKALQALGDGDVLLVTRLDRLARSTRDLLNVLATISEKGAGFRSLADAWADTTTPHGKLMITVLGGLAEFERSSILARTGEGRVRAMARVSGLVEN
jgi:hypothetical protein